MTAPSSDRPGGVSRRQFLRIGVMGGIALSTVSATALLTGCASAPLAPGFAVLRSTDLVTLRAVAGVVLSDELPADPAARAAAIDETLKTLDAFLAGTSVAGQKQLLQLLDLMHMPATRYTVVGLSQAWEDASPGEIGKFLEHWRNSRFDTLRAGYNGLTQALNMMWYLQPRAWAAIGFEPPHVLPPAAASMPSATPSAVPAAAPVSAPAAPAPAIHS